MTDDTTPTPPPATSFLKAFVDGYITLGLGGDFPVYPGSGVEKLATPYSLIRQTGGLEYHWPASGLLYLIFKVMVLAPKADVKAFSIVFERAQAAHDALQERRAWELNGYRAELIRTLQPPFDDGILNGMQSISFNVLVSARKLPSPPTTS